MKCTRQRTYFIVRTLSCTHSQEVVESLVQYGGLHLNTGG